MPIKMIDKKAKTTNKVKKFAIKPVLTNPIVIKANPKISITSLALVYPSFTFSIPHQSKGEFG
ncbi:unnamed protein product, partial [marine sediment metagenome]